MEIVDARQAFLKRNKNCLQIYLRQLPQAQSSAIQLLPLIFHVNSRLLPGYNGPDAPYGVYGYEPEKTTIGLARKLNSRFHVEHAGILGNAPIEALFVKYSFLKNKMSLWLVHAADMKEQHQKILEDKLYRVNAWLRSRDLEAQANLVSAAGLTQHGLRKEANEYFASAALFLDSFYTESFLLAGKYPVWWLVPPELEEHYADFVDKIKVARFVPDQEYIDLGGLAASTPHELMKQAMDCVHDVQKFPEVSWPKLLLLNTIQKSWPKIDGTAIRMKHHVYLDDTSKEVTADNMMREVLFESIEDMGQADHLMPPDRLLAALKQYSSKGGLLASLVPQPKEHYIHLKPQAFDAMRYIQTSRALMREIGLAFNKIIDRYQSHAKDEASQQQLSLAQNMLQFLSEPKQRVPVITTRPNAELLQGRVIFRHVIAPIEHWKLLVGAVDEQEKILYESSSLLALIAWAWLNYVVDKSTQVAVDCPLRAVKQIDARHALEVLVSHLDRTKIIETSREVFNKPREVQYAMVFIHLVMDEVLRAQIEALEEKSAKENTDLPLQLESLIGHCEQLVMSNWGDVEVKRYAGESGVLQCLCDWLMYGATLPKPKALPLQAHGYAAGASTYLAQRTGQIYAEMIDFFLKKKTGQSRFIVRLGEHYYCLQRDEHGLQVNLLGNEAALLLFLETTTPEFVETGIERMSMLGMPLREIYQRNKPGMVQLFYRVANRTCDTWILDERGSLCHFRQDWYDRDSYLTRWLYFLRNVRNRMKNISYQNRELTALELTQISNNRLGVIEFNRIGAESVNAQRNFMEIQLQVEGAKNGDRLTLICDGRYFDYQTYTSSVMTEALQYINARMIGEGRKPVYVTDIDVPLRLFNVSQREDIQTLHFLKYCRNFENRMNQLLGMEYK
ncbi:MAG: class I adenylate cyclase [Gammaproteobacteria bacterium]|nr:class I adenylate cyclase [Gammaproteobacteria bacterium]